MELRHLRYFVTVAEELNFGRAAERLHIAGPSLSQQIKVLERDLKVRLLDRDRRGVSLTPGGAALLPHIQALVDQADEMRREAIGMTSTPVRLGYVAWCPIDWAERTASVAHMQVDNWVMPSHIQAGRVAEGSLDLAICWVQTTDLERLGLGAHLVGMDRLYAVGAGTDESPIRAKDALVLLDSDGESWRSWNRYGELFAEQFGAPTLEIADGGITGPTFFEHVRRTRRPVLNSPMGQTAQLPRDLVHRPIVDLAPIWTWSLVWRLDDDRPAVHAVIDALTRGTATAPSDGETGWLPPGDPFRSAPDL